MSLLPGLTQTSPGVPIFAPASGGGGGGGGPNLTLSTILMAANSNTTPFEIIGGDSQVQVSCQIDAQGEATFGVFNNAGIANGLEIATNSDIGITRVFGLGGGKISLENISSINGATPGGGGSVGPQLSNISSILWGGNYTATYGYQLNMVGQGAPASIVVNNGGQSAPYSIVLGTGLNASNLGPALSNAPYGQGGNYVMIQDAGNNTNQLIMGAISGQNNLIASLDNAGNLSTLNVLADGVNISSLKVSSINGATPGGGGSVGCNLTLSTLTVSSILGNPAVPSGPSLNWLTTQGSDGSGRTYLTYNSSDGAGFGTYPIAATNVPAGVPAGNIPCSLDSNGNPYSFAVGPGSTGTQGALIFNGNTTDNWIIGGDGGMTLYAGNSINLSTTSILQNGAPLGTGYSVQKLGWLNAGSNDLSPGMTPGQPSTLTTASSALTNGHTYRVTAAFGLSNSKEDGETAITIEGSWGGLPASLLAVPNLSISTSMFTTAGYSGYFTTAGGSGGVTIGGTNTGGGATAVVGDNSYVLLEDLGVF